MHAQRTRTRQAALPGFLRMPGLDLRGTIIGIPTAEPDEHDRFVGQVMRFQPDERVPVPLSQVNGLRGVAGWPARHGRREFTVRVGIDHGDSRLRLVALTEPELRQERSAVRVAAELPCRLWWVGSQQIHRVGSVTMNLSASGLAVVLPGSMTVARTELPRPGVQLGAAVQLPEGEVLCVAEVVGYLASVGRNVARLRILRCRRADVTRLARFVIQTDARRG